MFCAVPTYAQLLFAADHGVHAGNDFCGTVPSSFTGARWDQGLTASGMTILTNVTDFNRTCIGGNVQNSTHSTHISGGAIAGKCIMSKHNPYPACTCTPLPWLHLSASQVCRRSNCRQVLAFWLHYFSCMHAYVTSLRLPTTLLPAREGHVTQIAVCLLVFGTTSAFPLCLAECWLLFCHQKPSSSATDQQRLANPKGMEQSPPSTNRCLTLHVLVQRQAKLSFMDMTHKYCACCCSPCLALQCNTHTPTHDKGHNLVARLQMSLRSA